MKVLQQSWHDVLSVWGVSLAAVGGREVESQIR